MDNPRRAMDEAVADIRRALQALDQSVRRHQHDPVGLRHLLESYGLERVFRPHLETVDAAARELARANPGGVLTGAARCW